MMCILYFILGFAVASLIWLLLVWVHRDMLSKLNDVVQTINNNYHKLHAIIADLQKKF